MTPEHALAKMNGEIIRTQNRQVNTEKDNAAWIGFLISMSLIATFLLVVFHFWRVSSAYHEGLKHGMAVTEQMDSIERNNL